MSESHLIEDARLAETVERYEDMAKFMKEYVESDENKGLDADQRNLLSVAYKNVVGTRRSAWRVLSSLEEKAKDNKETLIEYKGVIEEELKKICDEVIKLLEDRLIHKQNPEADNKSEYEAQIFFLKMKGDYYRYLCEVAAKDKRDEPLGKAEEAYQQAFDLAESGLEATHPIRLGLALNFSVFFYEIKESPGKACEVAKKAFDDAIAKLDTLQEDSHKDSTLIMQLLRDNLTLWTSGTADEEEDGGAN